MNGEQTVIERDERGKVIGLRTPTGDLVRFGVVSGGNIADCETATPLPSRLERTRPYVEYGARALAALVSRLVEWTLLLTLAAFLLAAARWLWFA